MNINATLLNEIRPYLYSYDCYPSEIEHFLTTNAPFLERQHEAIQIIENIMAAHGKQELHRPVAELARVECGIRELEPRLRDHVVHAVLSFLLGIYLNEKFFRPLIGTPVDRFQWKVAGLFHDVGYPVQVATKGILKAFAAKINEIKRTFDVSAPEVYFEVVPRVKRSSPVHFLDVLLGLLKRRKPSDSGLENLTNGLNSFDLIQKRLNDWGLRINAKKEYHKMIRSGEICHGIISSLTILHVIDFMYQKYNPKRKYSDIYAVRKSGEQNGVSWNQTYFERDIISACSAIYIHNLPSRCFGSAKIDPSKAPIAFLLKLSDCLQEWERPSLTNPTGFSATQFDVKIDNDQLILRANIPDDKRKKIRQEISLSLASPRVEIP